MARESREGYWLDETIDDQFPSQPELDAQLPQFRLIRKLSETKMSVIYLAEERHLGNRPVAVKVIAPMLAHEPSFRERFRREMLSAANLSHPNIVPVFSAPGSDDGHDELLYLVMPYIDGPNLSSLLKEHGPLDLAWTVHLIREVAAALDFAHARGVVHRDVKPGNILIEKSSNRVLLCDFGIAAPALGERLTEVGRRVGTPGYLAPELIPASTDTAAPVDPRADVYSLGVVLFQCLTGRAPHQQSDTDALLWAQGHEEIPPVTALRPGLPEGLNRVLRSALAKRPEERYGTCRELADELTAAASGGRVRGAPRKTRTRRRLPWKPVAAVLAAVAVAATVVVVVNKLAGGADGADSPLRRIPPPLRGDCESAAASKYVSGAAETLECNDGTWEVTVSLFTDKSTMDSAYTTAIRDGGVTRASGDCTVATGAEHRYPNGGQQVGRVLCYTAENVTSLVWTDDRQRTIIEADAAEADDAEFRQAWAGWVGIPDFPTDDEQSLINLVEGLVEPGWCERTPAGTLDTFRDLVAAIDCDPVHDGVTSVTYYRFGDAEGLRRTYGQHVDEVNAPAGEDCTDEPPPDAFLGNSRWDQRSVDMGEMLCYLGERSEPVLEWTVEPLRVMGRATGTEPAEVAGWWSKTLGIPPEKVVQGANAQAKFPNAEEAKLLQHVPPASRKLCMRPSEGQVKKNVGNAKVTGVVCGPSSGAHVIFYYQFADAAEMTQAYQMGQEVSGGDCTKNPPNFAADAPYQRGGDTGRLSCRAFDGVPQISWTSDKHLILAFGFQGYSQQELLAWWQNEAGPT